MEKADPGRGVYADRHYDTGLSEEGIKQAIRLGQCLEAEGSASHVFCSPFLGAVETAHYVCERLDLPILVEQGLSDCLDPSCFPERPVCVPIGKLVVLFPRIDVRYDSLVHPRFPESPEDALARSGIAVKMLVEKYEGNLVIIGHGHSVLGASHALVGRPPTLNCELCCLVRIVQTSNSWEFDQGAASPLAPGL